MKKGEHQTERNLLEQEHCREAEEVNCVNCREEIA